MMQTAGTVLCAHTSLYIINSLKATKLKADLDSHIIKVRDAAGRIELS